MVNKGTIVFDFDGDAETLIDKIENFVPWNKQ